MPSRGRRRCSGTARLIVGNPSARPRFSPWTTVPCHAVRAAEETGRASHVAGEERVADASRADHFAPSITGVATTTSKPCLAPAAASARRRRRGRARTGSPRRRRCGARGRRHDAANELVGAVSAANSLVKWKTTTSSAPASCSRRTRSSTSDSADGGAPGASAWIGSGSNVAASALAPCCLAPRRSAGSAPDARCGRRRKRRSRSRAALGASR